MNKICAEVPVWNRVAFLPMRFSSYSKINGFLLNASYLKLSPQKNPHQVKNCNDSWKKECIKWTLITHLQKTFFTLSNSIRCETKDCSGRILLFHPYHSKQNASLLDIKAHGNSHWFKFSECYKNRQMMMHASTP